MSRESLKHWKDRRKKGTEESRRACKCEVMEREAVTGGGHTISVLACGCAEAVVFTHLSKNMEEKGWGSVKKGHTRGVCHIVWR